MDVQRVTSIKAPHFSTQKHVRKVVGGFGKEVVFVLKSERPRKHMCVTVSHDLAFGVKVA